VAILLMAIVAILLMVIVAILLMAIGGYSINDYW
jgi:4-hydroxybenzoate polyprenyltransferase